MAGGAAGLGDHGHGPAHRHSVFRQGLAGDQHHAPGDFPEIFVLEMIDPAHGRAPGGDDAVFQEHLGAFDLGRQIIGAQLAADPQGPGLEQVKLAVRPQGPLDVLGAAEMLFDNPAQGRQGQDLFLRQARPLALRRDVPVQDAALGGRHVHPDLFAHVTGDQIGPPPPGRCPAPPRRPRPGSPGRRPH